MAETELVVITNAINKFSKNLYNELKNQAEDANDLISAVNIHAFLTLLSRDPWFCKTDIFKRVLHFDVESAFTHYKDVFVTFNRVNDVLIANTCFLKSSKVLDAFRNCLTGNFASEVNLLNFTKPKDATAAINAWVRDRTVQKITPLAGLKGDVNCAFLNATRFKGNWAEQFSANETVPATFYLNEESTVQVQMMRKRGEFCYKDLEDFDVKMLKLPFVGSNVSLVILLPNNDTNIEEIMQNFFDNSALTLFTKEDKEKQVVDVSLPKFKIYESVELGQYLKKMGLEEVFSASLDGVIDNEDLTFDAVRQKAYLEVNEEGAEAVAGTVSTLTKSNEEEVIPKDGLIIYEANISSEITNRFAKTKVVWRVKNSNDKAADADFKVILTDTAFITEFVMEIDGKSYKSYIKEKEEAKNIYNEAVAHGQSAGLVEAKTRDSREFTVSVNLEPDSVAVFSLTYEEMLQRVHDQYELVLNICPGQIIDDLNIEIRINESRSLKFVKTPPLRPGNDTNTSETAQYLDPLADIKMITRKMASIKFRPNAARQRKLTHYLGNKTSDGLSGQFVVQYDVEREPLNGEVLLQDGYFVHFFASNDLDPLPKHLVFVLDTSGSMRGRKIEQLKDAMMNILSDLRKEDMLSIIEFNNDVIVWDVNSKKSATVPVDKIADFKEPFAYLRQCILADPHLVSKNIIKKAKEVVKNITANGCTFMIGGLETGLYLVKTGQQKNKGKDQKLQPIIVFLTDGEPNVGINSKDQIVELVTHLNVKDKVPIFSLSFGNNANKDFLRKLSLRNLGFSRHIYEAADASLQLQEFYKQISSPLLQDIKFKYDAEVEEVTRSWFPIYFRGSELVVAGRCGKQTFPTAIDCCGPRGPIIIRSATKKPVTPLERLWAYLTVKQLLDERDLVENPEELIKKAVNLALKYSFVTDVTSLVVVKPNETNPIVENRISEIDTEGMVPPRFYKNTAASDSSCFHCSFLNKKRRIANFCPCASGDGRIVGGIFYPRYRGGGGSICVGADPVCSSTSDHELSLEDEDMEVDSENEPVEEFTADHPFLVFLQVEKDDAVLILFQGSVCKPNY